MCCERKYKTTIPNGKTYAQMFAWTRTRTICLHNHARTYLTHETSHSRYVLTQECAHCTYTCALCHKYARIDAWTSNTNESTHVQYRARNGTRLYGRFCRICVAILSLACKGVATSRKATKFSVPYSQHYGYKINHQLPSA